MKEGHKKDALDDLLDGALKYEHVSAAEGTLADSCEGTPAFEVRVEVTIELHLKVQLVMHMLVQKNAQNDSIKCEIEEELYVALEGAPKISL